MALETKLRDKGISQEVKVEIKKTTKKKVVKEEKTPQVTPQVEEINNFDPRQQIKHKRK